MSKLNFPLPGPLTEELANVPATVHLYLKHDDRTAISLFSDAGEVVAEQSGDYLPNVGILGGDETRLTIDNRSGVILNWTPIKTLSE